MSDAHEGESADKAVEDGTDKEGEKDDQVADASASAVPDAHDDPLKQAQPSKHEKDRHHERRIALMNVLSILASGLLAAVVALMVSNNQIESSERQSVEEFRREQRKADYPRILSLATDLKNATDVAGSDLSALGSRSYGNSYVKPYFYNGQYWSAPRGSYLGTGAYTGDPYTGGDYYPNNSYTDYYAATYNSPLGAVRTDWQSAYGRLDQAIAEAQIVGTPKALGLARALRDSYRKQYAKSLTEQLDAINEASHVFSLQVWEQAPPAQRSPEPPKAPKKLADMSDGERNAELNQFIGVGDPDPDNLGYDGALVSKSPCELTTEYVAVAKDELELDEELFTQQCRAS